MSVRKIDAVFFSDPGHGWYAVDVDELRKYGVVQKISAFSYYDEKHGLVYLEEDCDVVVFESAVRAAGHELVIHDRKPAVGDSFVRRLPYYSAQVVQGLASY